MPRRSWAWRSYTSDGRKFLDACSYLNTANTDIERDEAATAVAVKRFLRFLRTEPEKKEAIFRRLVRFASRLYLFAFEGLEATTALNNPKVMAAGVRTVGAEYNLPAPCRQWLKTPEDAEALVWSFVAAFQQQKIDGTRAGKAWDMERPETEESTAGTLSFGKGKGYGGSNQWDADEEEFPSNTKGSWGKATGVGGGGSSSQRGTKRLAADAFASDEEAAARGLDLDSSSDDAADTALDLQGYTQENLTQLKSLLADIGAKDARERPPISDLQNALKLLPTSATSSLGLQPTIETFIGKTRYPKAANLLPFLEALKKMADSLEEALKTAPPAAGE